MDKLEIPFAQEKFLSLLLLLKEKVFEELFSF